jgi:hypothetical protein
LDDAYEATTLGGLASEIEGRIPLAGEVVLLEPIGLRMEVVASTDRRVERLRVFPPAKYDAQAPGTGAKFDRSELTIVARTNENTPNCCAKHVDEVTFAWISGKFQQVRYRVMPVVDPQARKSP